MNNQESFDFIKEYFDQLFSKRNIDALDIYLDKAYFDDDIGESQTDHIHNSKEFLANLFRENPTIGIEVKDTIVRDNVISAYLEWFILAGDTKRILRKGVAIFVVEHGKIRKRHTYIYLENHMKTYISMLRGINVGGQKKVRMAELKSLYESLGFEDVATYVQSGNVVFKGEEQDAEKLAEKIEGQIEKDFGFSVPALVRSADDFQRVIETHPFKDEEPVRVLVTFLYEHPEQSKLEELRRHEDKVDKFAIGEQEIFLFCPGGYGKTKLSNTFFEKKLGVAATTRNWKTVNTLYEMAKAS